MTPPADDELSRRHCKPFLEHLQDLRRAILRSLAALAIGMAAAVPLARPVMRWMKEPLALAGVNPDTFLRVFTVTGGFDLAMRTILLTGLVLSAPFLVFFAAGFVAPGLTSRERRTALRFAVPALLLFLAGVALAYWVILPLGLRVMFDIGGWIGARQEFVDAGDYLAFCLYLLLGFGLSFELPVVVVLLGYLGVVTGRMLRRSRSYVIVAVLFLAMVVTPTTDVVSMGLMALPLILLHEGAIWIVWWHERSRDRGPSTDRVGNGPEGEAS